jgi:mRNA-degrading endonuclease RelE of RelBE toxin-antitoxin system
MKWLFIALGIYAVGCVAVSLLCLFARVRDGKWGGDNFLVILIWPALLLFPIFMVSEAISRRKQRKRTEAAKREFETLIDSAVAVVKSAVNFDPEAVEIYSRALTRFKAGGYRTIPSRKLEKSIRQFWLSGGEPFDYADNIHEVYTAAVRRSFCPGSPPRAALIRYSVRQGWLIAMSHEFIKAIDSIDRKLQGRILEALADISRDPLTVKGDTVKPLTHEMRGLWRYRLGDYRLVYQPLPEKNEILLVDFDSRGAVYA